MRVVTFNMHGGIGTDGMRDYRRISDLLRHIKADIAMLQEFDSRPSEGDGEQDLDDLVNHPFRYFKTGATRQKKDGWYGNLILSRFPFSSFHTHNISMPGREPRSLMDGVVDTPGGPLRVFNAHLGLAGPERMLQARHVMRILEQEKGVPVIFGGDINEWKPYAPVIKVLNEELTHHPCGATFPSRWPVFHLDRIWCRPAGLIQETEVLRLGGARQYSDHLPVMAHLSGT